MTEKEIIRTYYGAWEKRDWSALDRLLASTFTFTSPNGDDHIDKKVFYAKCWPQAEWVEHFDLESIADGDRDAFVKYCCRTTRGTSFRNVEYVRFECEKITAIECYFGGQDGYPSNSASKG